jgi:hypothetical protein
MPLPVKKNTEKEIIDIYILKKKKKEEEKRRLFELKVSAFFCNLYFGMPHVNRLSIVFNSIFGSGFVVNFP